MNNRYVYIVEHICANNNKIILGIHSNSDKALIQAIQELQRLKSSEVFYVLQVIEWNTETQTHKIYLTV